jgi:hypothetical protein
MAAPQNPVFIQLGIYIRDLLDYSESLIKFGRDNAELENTDINYIVVDELASVPMGGAEQFDGVLESMSYGRAMVGGFTINFYGTNAYINSRKYQLLQGSQKSYELQRDLKIAVYHSSNVADLRYLGGTQYSNRYEIELKVGYYETADVDTLRIDTLELDVLNNK